MNAPRNLFDRGITSLASRDVRLFILMIGALTGQGFITLIVLASLTNAVVLLRVLHMRRILDNAEPTSVVVEDD